MQAILKRKIVTTPIHQFKNGHCNKLSINGVINQLCPGILEGFKEGPFVPGEHLLLIIVLVQKAITLTEGNEFAKSFGLDLFFWDGDSCYFISL
jgi:hypothetical protein